MEEFQEADVLWPDKHHHGHEHPQKQQRSGRDDGGAVRRPGGAGAPSVPVGIPAVSTTTVRPWPSTAAEHEEAATSSWAAFVPPREAAAARARRSSEEAAAFSVCVGHGRTLKGRDLRCVRTAVLRMTGFLET
ncbi:hypothetical protein GUJ93_ZPchr0010g8608 [Zizania palustris]|uniref:Uncharacterized protein n=1 Tax=Zizania palustris TaxID=103762 RepID=A0A8J5WD32_ZIZPA|nr:hypothetical protein GUJ93_ZPchr0010g8608 [Zizania palustris]